jgi:hypothetical protein
MLINNCQILRQKIIEAERKVKNIVNLLLLEYKNTGNEEITKQLDRFLPEIEESENIFIKILIKFN